MLGGEKRHRLRPTTSLAYDMIVAVLRGVALLNCLHHSYLSTVSSPYCFLQYRTEDTMLSEQRRSSRTITIVVEKGEGDLYGAMKEPSLQTDSEEDDASRSDDDMDDEQDDFIIAIGVALVAEAYHRRRVARAVTESSSKGGRRPWTGRVMGPSTVSREPSHWMRYYMGPNLMYPTTTLHRVFHVPRTLFWRIISNLIHQNHTKWSTRTDGFGRKGKEAEIKVMVCLRLLGSARSLRDLDDGACMGKETIWKYFCQLCIDMRTIYGPTYLNWRSTSTEIGAVATTYDRAGFYRWVGAVDVMEVQCKNCASSHEGQYYNPKDGKLATIRVEASCDHELYMDLVCGEVRCKQ